MNNKTKEKILNPFNLLVWALVVLSIIFLYDGSHIYILIIVSITCTAKFITMNRRWTCYVALINTLALIFVLNTFLTGDYIYILLILTILAHIIPMYWFVFKNKPSIIYK